MDAAIAETAERKQRSPAPKSVITPQQAAVKARPHPSLCEIHTRVLLNEVTQALGHHATLVDITDEELDRLARQGFNWLWFLGVWKTGTAARKLSQSSVGLQTELRRALPDLRKKDVCGSCFAIQAYEVHPDFGGNGALERLRARIHARGMRLLLDFVPNHTALDHEWVRTNHHYYVCGTEEQIEREPHNYTRPELLDSVLAYGRDPHFAGWPDTLQLNYANPDLQDAMASELESIAELCDGVRCDMPMLLLPDVFERTWGQRPAPFWPHAIERVHARHPEFLFLAEAYWELEWALQQQGFDYTYDKRLYERLRDGKAQLVRDHFGASPEFQRKSVRFLENHDEARAAAAFPDGQHQAAAVLTYLCPGLRFFHHGQMEGLTKRTSVHLSRAAPEPVNTGLRQFYERLLSCLRNPVVREGEWQLLECSPAWDGNWSNDSYICFAWRGRARCPLLVAVNFAPHQSQCYVRAPFEEFRGQPLRLRDLTGKAVYSRHADDLLGHGLYLDLPAWGYHVFELTASPEDQGVATGK